MRRLTLSPKLPMMTGEHGLQLIQRLADLIMAVTVHLPSRLTTLEQRQNMDAAQIAQISEKLTAAEENQNALEAAVNQLQTDVSVAIADLKHAMQVADSVAVASVVSRLEALSSKTLVIKADVESTELPEPEAPEGGSPDEVEVTIPVVEPPPAE